MNLEKLKIYADKKEELDAIIKEYNSKLDSIYGSVASNAVSEFRNYFQKKDFSLGSNGFLTTAHYKGLCFRVDYAQKDATAITSLNFEFPIGNPHIVHIYASSFYDKKVISNFKLEDPIEVESEIKELTKQIEDTKSTMDFFDKTTFKYVYKNQTYSSITEFFSDIFGV
jgi:hypothetical protein